MNSLMTMMMMMKAHETNPRIQWIIPRHTHTHTHKQRKNPLYTTIYSFHNYNVYYLSFTMYVSKVKVSWAKKKKRFVTFTWKKTVHNVRKKTTLQWIINRRIHIDTHNGIAYGRQTHILDKKEKSRWNAKKILINVVDLQDDWILWWWWSLHQRNNYNHDHINNEW